MERELNAKQMEVLRWIVDGCPDGRWPEGDISYKAAANALANRRLVMVQKIPPPWRAEPTSAGRHYAETGNYPKGHTFSDIDLTPVERIDRQTPVLSSSPAARAPGKVRAADEPIGPRTQLRRANRNSPVVRLLQENPHWLQIPKSLHPRVHRIAQYLSDEAGRLGWAIALPDHPPEDWHGWRFENGRKLELMTLNAGHEAVEILAKSPKATPGEPAHLRIEAGRMYGAVRKIEDTKRTFVEDKLGTLLDHVAHRSLVGQRMEYERAIWQEEHARREREARVLQSRVWRYTAWRDSLVALEDRWAEHARTKAFLTEFESRVTKQGDAHGNDAMAEYLVWAKRYVEESDPLVSPPLPSEDLPDLTYEEWVGAKLWRQSGRRSSR